MAVCIFMSSRVTDLRAGAGGDEHAARMDAIYGWQRHFYDLTRKYYLLGRDRLIRDLDVPAEGSVLELGCGTGRNLAAVGARYRSARLYGLDISDEMLKSARRNLRPMQGRSQVVQGDATRFDARALFGRGSFERVFLSYTLSMIPDWQAAIAAGLEALAPGGRLHIVDFGQQRRLPSWFRPLLRGWLARFDVTPRVDLLEQCERLAAQHGLRCEVRSLYRDYAWSVTLG